MDAKIICQVIVQGQIDPSWSSWLTGMQVRTVEEQAGQRLTTLVGELPDQVALRGLLNRLWDLNLELCSVQIGVSDVSSANKERES